MSMSLQFDPLANPCFTCNLWQDKKNPCIRPKTYKEGGLVLIGESPSEDTPGVTPVGRAERTLKESLDSLNVTEYTLLYAVRCRPTHSGGGRTPTTREVDLCRTFLLDDLRLLRPSGIICLGAAAARAMELPPLPLRELRHRQFWVEIGSEITLVEAPEGPRIDSTEKPYDLIRTEAGTGQETLPGGFQTDTVSRHREMDTFIPPRPSGIAGSQEQVFEFKAPVWVTYHPDAYRRPGKSNLLHEMQQDLARYLTPMPPYPETAMDEQGAVYFPQAICVRCGDCGGAYNCPGCGQPNRNPLRREGLPEDRTLTNPSDYAILNLEMEEESNILVKPIGSNKAPTGPIYNNILVLDIETTGFLKGYKALPFDKGHIVQIGWDEGDGYQNTEP